MKAKRWILTVASLIFPILMHSSQAGISVTQVNQDTLRVVDYSGKPPYKRRMISASTAPEAFDRYSSLLDHTPQALQTTNRRSGPPGKSVGRQGIRINARPIETSEPSSAPEDNGPTNPHRMWRGAPGKNTR